jgi:hypothetical protein
MAASPQKRKREQPINSFFVSTKAAVPQVSTHHLPTMPPVKPKFKTTATGKSESGQKDMALARFGPETAATGKNDTEKSHVAPCKPRPKIAATTSSNSEKVCVDPTKTTQKLSVANLPQPKLNYAAAGPRSVKKRYTATMKLTQDMTVAELKTILRANRCPVSGKKAALLARLSELNEMLDQAERKVDEHARVIPETPVKAGISKVVSDGREGHDPSILVGMRVRTQEGRSKPPRQCSQKLTSRMIR